ncbi:MAG: ORF6N domain-containing protein [Clostridium sp.]|nr:ORF6N domain-containing protein [Clostridium sp.]MCM1444496.1 ORF6N domain-containing protein [Candidatus Amulumruptor caecigallinarius]
MNGIETINKIKIEDMIYEVRGKQVMLDSDLAKLYACSTGNLNRARTRNIKRFPLDFCFQLTREEFINLKCQSGISKIDMRSINRNLPYVYTEQGIAMLSTVLHSDISIEMSISIMNAFVSMRKYISNNLIEQKYINNLVLNHDKKINLIEETFSKFEEKIKINFIFFEGQIYDAYSLLIDILNKSKSEIIVIDNYAGKELLYHCGSSFKDLGKKCFGINLIDNKNILDGIIKMINGN